MAIEKERYISDIKYNKEIQNALSFSLSTAEQSLQESQPHVVTKLVEGRNKRLKILEKSLHERKRDLDQRSAETCAVSSAHLDGFQVKAVVLAQY